MLALLFTLILAPTARADGEPQRFSASVFNARWDEATGAWDVTICPRWTNATVGDSYAITVNGADLPIDHEDVPFRPGWSWPVFPGNDNCADFDILGTEVGLDVAISACSGCALAVPGTILATSCNVTVEPIDTFGNIGGSAYMCGSPQYTPDIRLGGSGEVSGNTTTFRLNHSLHIQNATSYQYQFQTSRFFSLWSNAEPVSSATINGGNLSQAPSLDGYRLANFTFTDLDPDTPIQWRVRAHDTFTIETSPYSCIISLAPSTDSFAKTCYARRATFADVTGPTWPMVNLTNVGNALGVSDVAAGGILLMGLAATLAGIAMLTSRSPGAATGAIALTIGGGWIYNITPGWVLVMSFYAASLLILARIIPGGDE